MTPLSSTAQYPEFVHHRAQTNPCITRLFDNLNKKSKGTSRIVSLDYPHDQGHEYKPRPLSVAEDGIVEHIGGLAPQTTRLLFVENINANLISRIGEELDIDPLFFASYVNTGFEDLETVPPPPYLAILPSLVVPTGHVHLHYQQVLDLDRADRFVDATYVFKTDANVPRSVRRLVPLSEKQLGLSRTCCSFLVKPIKDSFICIFLVDPPITTVVDASKNHQKQASLLHGGFEDFGVPSAFSSFKAGQAVKPWNRSSMLDSIVHHLLLAPPVGFSPASPSILSLAHFPLRIVLSQWNLYTQLTSRCAKHYEYSIRDLEKRLHADEIVDLQRWRRRSKSSQQKLGALGDMVRHHMRHEASQLSPEPWELQESWELVLNDIEYLQKQLQDYSLSIEQMVTMATSMLQLLDSRRSIMEAANVRRLTYVAVFFIPLGWVASIFSMSDKFSPGSEHFWVYFATSLPLLVLVVLLSALPYEYMVSWLGRVLGRSWG